SIIVDLYNNSKMTINNDVLKNRLHDANFDDYIIQGKTIEITGYYNIEVRSIDFGFDMEPAIYKKNIRRINKKSNAYKIGIRNGKIDEIHINVNKGTVMIKQNNKNYTFNMFIGENIKVPQLKKLK
ncbi:MAG: hypothetical protein MUO21_01920, partial [Nitrososphaeraceae archaeon]|nr:hypothetical protein [Nitrososphaeraceae archaeon]